MPAERKLPIMVTSRIKTSVARARFKRGSGRIKVNSYPIENWLYEPHRSKAMTPILLLSDEFKSVDVDINVRGGGSYSQARAVMVALAKGIIHWSRSGSVRRLLRNFDRYMLTGDARFKEPKKFGGPGARRRFQKSYR